MATKENGPYGCCMLISGDNDSYEYEYNVPEVHALWGLRETRVDPNGKELDTSVKAVSEGPLGIEKRIQKRLDEQDVVLVAGSMWQRVLRLRDGSQIVFDIILEVADWRCLDCGQDMSVVDEYYMVHDDIWLSVVPGQDGHLCIGCLEGRLGRELVAADFKGRRALGRKVSPRLQKRLNQ